MSLILDILGLGRVLQAIGALLALVVMIGLYVLYFGGQEELRRSERLVQGVGEITALGEICRMVSEATGTPGYRV